MKELNYREPKDGRRFAAWLNKLRNSSGAYVVRRRSDHEILYIGESHTGRLAKTIKRHFFNWEDHTGREHFTHHAGAVEIAVRVTPPNTAKGAQDNLIRRLQPERNVIVPKDPAPF
jgi:hypothetical protein